MKNSLANIHHELLSLLKDIDKICYDNNIKYSLFAGTLIGAVRHKGFVPWDDDADVIFERVEYEKFLKVLPEEFTIFRSPWVPRFTRKDGTSLFIDVFVFDEISNNTHRQKQQILKIKFLQGTMKSSITTNKGFVGLILSLITYLIGKCVPLSLKLKLYDAVAQSNNTEANDFIFSSLDQFKYIKYILPKSILSNYKYINFEDTKLQIMEGYDIYLRQFYGDYMKLPEESKRVPEHGNLDKI